MVDVRQLRTMRTTEIISCIVVGCRDGDVRLTGGSSEEEGTVEVCSKKTWGMVSGLGWGEEDARVVCRQLRFQAEGELLPDIVLMMTMTLVSLQVRCLILTPHLADQI